MNFTIFGYPKTGKTTLFNLLTGAHVTVHAYEEGKREPNVRTCSIPDERLDVLWEIYREKKKVQAAVDLVDLAGISYGEVKSSTLLGHLRKADGLLHVVRAFENPAVPPPKPVNPKGDILAMEDELLLADLVSIETRLERLDRDLKKAKDPEGEKERDLLQKLRGHVEQEKGIRGVPLTASEEKMIRSFAFLSQKPLLHAVNLGEKDIPGISEAPSLFASKREETEVLAFSGQVESEILDLENGDKQTYMAEFGLTEIVSSRFYPAVPRLLSLCAFFTIGKDEVRAWMVKRGSPAHTAAGAIHSDIEKGFIRAEVISWKDLCAAGSLQAAKDKGSIRLEGKEYIVQDGDVIYFRFAP